MSIDARTLADRRAFQRYLVLVLRLGVSPKVAFLIVRFPKE